MILQEETHARFAKPEGDRKSAYNNALKYAKQYDVPFIYGYVNHDGKFFALDTPVKCSDPKAEYRFRGQYKNCAVVYMVYPDKNFIEGVEIKESYDFEAMLEALAEYEGDEFEEFDVDNKVNELEQCGLCKEMVPAKSLLTYGKLSVCPKCFKFAPLLDDEQLDEYYNQCCSQETDDRVAKPDNAVVDCKVNTVITHSEDEKPLDCKMEKKPLEKPLTENTDNSFTIGSVIKSAEQLDEILSIIGEAPIGINMHANSVKARHFDDNGVESGCEYYIEQYDNDYVVICNWQSDDGDSDPESIFEGNLVDTYNFIKDLEITDTSKEFKKLLNNTNSMHESVVDDLADKFDKIDNVDTDQDPFDINW